MPSSPNQRIKRLRVHADRQGVLQPGKAPRAPADPWPPDGSPDAEILWRDILLDPRASIPAHDTRIEANSEHARYRLDRQSDPVIVSCPCGRSGEFDRTRLVANFGAGCNVFWAVRHLFDCKTRNKVSNGCRAYAVR